MPVIENIVSGGQTGADRAALDWAIENGIPHGGWCPKGQALEFRGRLIAGRRERFEHRAYALHVVNDFPTLAVVTVNGSGAICL